MLLQVYTSACKTADLYCHIHLMMVMYIWMSASKCMLTWLRTAAISSAHSNGHGTQSDAVSFSSFRAGPLWTRMTSYPNRCLRSDNFDTKSMSPDMSTMVTWTGCWWSGCRENRSSACIIARSAAPFLLSHVSMTVTFARLRSWRVARVSCSISP